MVGHSVLHPLLLLGVAILSGAMLIHGPPSTLYPVAEEAPVGGIALDDAVPVSSGTTLTIWEQTTNVSMRVFQMSEVISTGVSFFTAATVSEIYSVTSDGTFVTIYCYKVPPEPMTGIGTGNNIVAVRLDGVAGHPEGLYASTIVSYVVGVGGVEESRWNALGPETQVGPYMDLPYTSMGDYGSELVLGFEEPAPVDEIEASLDIDPDTLNPKSNGRWVTCFLALPGGYDVQSIDIGSVLLNGVVPLDASHEPVYSDSGVTFKVDRISLLATLSPGESVLVEIEGELSDGTVFSGHDTVRVLDK